MTERVSPVVAAIDADGLLATVTLNRPEARNALNQQLAAELTAAFSALGDRTDLRALILTGAGDRAFCAGADLTERLTMTPAERSAHTEAINAVADALAAFPVPVIAAIRGFALAGGAELALACDLRVAAEDAVFGFPEVAIGIFPGAGGVVRLPRLIGAGRARDLLFSGRRIDAKEALAVGLVDRLTPPDQVLATARELALAIATNAPLAVRALKRALSESAGLPEAEAHRIVSAHRRSLDATADYAEGLAAFAERRSPHFRGV